MIADESRVRRREAAEKAAEDCFGEHALDPLAIGIAQVAVVLRDEPAVLVEDIQELLADPGLAMTGRADDQQAPAGISSLARRIGELRNRSRTRHLDRPVDRMRA